MVHPLGEARDVVHRVHLIKEDHEEAAVLHLQLVHLARKLGPLLAVIARTDTNPRSLDSPGGSGVSHCHGLCAKTRRLPRVEGSEYGIQTDRNNCHSFSISLEMES